MHRFRSLFLRMALVALPALAVSVLAPAPARAGYFPGYDITDLDSYLGGQGGNAAAVYELHTGPLTGTYSVTALAYEATHNDLFFSRFGQMPLFNNKKTNDFGNFVTDVDLSKAFFFDINDREIFSLSNADAVRVYRLTADWTAPGLDLPLNAGTLIFGLNDSWSRDKDYDDLILAASPTHTPIPGAVWLLGTGLFGLVGVRRALNRS